MTRLKKGTGIEMGNLESEVEVGVSVEQCQQGMALIKHEARLVGRNEWEGARRARVGPRGDGGRFERALAVACG